MMSVVPNLLYPEGDKIMHLCSEASESLIFSVYTGLLSLIIHVLCSLMVSLGDLDLQSQN